jgi:hypothetical protein
MDCNTGYFPNLLHNWKHKYWRCIKILKLEPATLEESSTIRPPPRAPPDT